MNTVRTITKNIGALTLMNIVTVALMLFLTIFIARYLGDVNFGKYSFALAFTALFGVFIHLGLDILITRDIARDKSKASKYLGNIAIIRALSSIIIFILIIIIINLMNYPSDTTTAVYIFGLYIIFTSFADIFKATFRAFERMEYQALINILERIIVVSLGLIVLFSGYGLIELASVFLFGGFFNILSSFLICRRKIVKPKFKIDLNFWRQSIKEAYPFLLVTTFVMIYFKIDTIMLSIMKGDAVVGWYNAAYMLIGGLGIISASILPALFPVMSRFFNNSKEALQAIYKNAFRYLLMIGFPIAVGTTLLADRIIPLLYGEQYSNSIIALQILIWAELFVFLNNTTGNVLNSINSQRANMKIVGTGAALNIILNLIFIPYLSYIGASIATVITEFFVVFAGVMYISKNGYVLQLSKDAIKIIAAGAVMGLFIFYSYNINLFSIILLSIAIYFGVLCLVKGITKEDLELVKNGIYRG
jgi:O-antigen/teichoic acid export membrane protein